MTRSLVLKVPEDSFQDLVVDFARLHGWRVAHFAAARTRDGWRTPGRYDAAGFPDLVLVRERVIFAELKGTTGQLRPEQRAWAEALQAAGVETYVWKPDCWAQIEQVLTTHQPPQRPTGETP